MTKIWINDIIKNIKEKIKIHRVEIEKIDNIMVN